MCVPIISGCTSRKLTPSKLATTAVGSVGNYEVSYEELYFLAKNYMKEGMTDEELWSVVGENIIANYAILTLCDEVGVEYDENEIDDAVQKYIDTEIIDGEFGSVSNYRKALKENGMTDNYVRFITKVDLLYEEIPSFLAEKGQLLTDNSKVCDYIEKNFVRTWHFMVANNKGDDTNKNVSDITEALDALRSGKTSIYALTNGSYKLSGGSKNEDLLMPINGYTFGKGSMEPAYENAAFALEVEEFSDVVMAKSELANGEYVDCYYVIQRLSLDKDFILDNYDEMYDTYTQQVVVEKLGKVRSSLSFVPNDFASTLKITQLEPVGIGTDVTAIIVIVAVVCVAIAIPVYAYIRIRHLRKRRKALTSSKGSSPVKK